MSTSSAPLTPPLKAPGPNEPCWCGSGTKYKKCHRGEDTKARAPIPESLRIQPGVVSPRREVPSHISRPDYAETGTPGPGVEGDPATRVERIRKACRAAAEVLQVTGRAVRPGIATDELDAIAHEEYIRRGGYPSTLNYRGYPKSICTSVNEVILHGIPDSRPLASGDIVNLDITIYLDGVHGDCSATFAVGEIDAASEQLMRVTRECMMLGIEAVRPGLPINVIGRAIETHARRYGYGVMRAYCGHGIGELFHCEPQIPHAYESYATEVMKEGMVFTIEPMLTMGAVRHVDWNDGWTVATADGKRSAQYEHTILVTRDGAEILSLTEPSALPV